MPRVELAPKVLFLGFSSPASEKSVISEEAEVAGEEFVFEFVLYCFLNAIKPEIRFRNSGEVTYFSENGVMHRLGWDTSTKAVGGTPANPS